MKNIEQIPKFRNENEEFNFWSKVDSTEYVDWDKSDQISFTNLKRTEREVKLNLPETIVR